MPESPRWLLSKVGGITFEDFSIFFVSDSSINMMTIPKMTKHGCTGKRGGGSESSEEDQKGGGGGASLIVNNYHYHISMIGASAKFSKYCEGLS